MVGQLMRRRWIVLGAAAAVLAVGVAAGLAASSAPPLGGGLARDLLGPRMARAEVVVVEGGVVHDYRVDQGRVVVNRLTDLLIREPDGTLQSVPVSPSARVTLNARPAQIGQVRRGMAVLTLRDGNSPATVVRVRGVFR
jgi:hypothetical protein